MPRWEYAQGIKVRTRFVPWKQCIYLAELMSSILSSTFLARIANLEVMFRPYRMRGFLGMDQAIFANLISGGNSGANDKPIARRLQRLWAIYLMAVKRKAKQLSGEKYNNWNSETLVTSDSTRFVG
jgi:hypothetical protein